MPTGVMASQASSLGIARLRPVNGSGVRAWVLFVEIEDIGLEVYGIAQGLDPNEMHVSLVSNKTEMKVSNTGLTDPPNIPKRKDVVGVWLVDANGTGSLFANLDLNVLSLDSLPINTVSILRDRDLQPQACGKVRRKL
ncbi:hypothetical protein MYX76_11300 [Desulfobacterota bacterium AH_259_B03_O07]|nr:hypothetical protein [Desulfobacterota bacterium AH_259_B03_O07]